MIEAVSWTLVSLPVIVALYSYIAYPVTLWILAPSKKHDPSPVMPDNLPTVTAIVPAYNERMQIRGAIDALLAQNYPPNLIDILVVSDASNDGTDDIVRDYGDSRVKLLRMSKRGGKTRAENHVAALLKSDIAVNTDASIRLHPSAIRELVVHMSDPSVGVASGRDVSISHIQDDSNVTEAGYVNYEMKIRALETRLGGIVGASGSCYAIRSSLHRLPIAEDLSRDFSAALTARIHGYRAVSVDSAICFVPRTPRLDSEYRRKVRTISRGIDTLWHNAQLLNPGKYGLFAWKLFSHKVCRWLLPLSVVPAIAGLLVLSITHEWARVVVGVGALAGVIAAIGAMWPKGRPVPRVVSLFAFGVAANVAVIAALHRVIFGHDDHIWEPTRRNIPA
jgi:cellulose synthase/poly-beta-1,6-N-acetylglucosamine synthase-like glycosyltransferase